MYRVSQKVFNRIVKVKRFWLYLLMIKNKQIMTTLFNMFVELSSFVDCEDHMEVTRDSDINTENSVEFKGLVDGWSNGEYDECPELLKQRLTRMYLKTILD